MKHYIAAATLLIAPSSTFAENYIELGYASGSAKTTYTSGTSFKNDTTGFVLLANYDMNDNFGIGLSYGSATGSGDLSGTKFDYSGTVTSITPIYYLQNTLSRQTGEGQTVGLGVKFNQVDLKVNNITDKSTGTDIVLVAGLGLGDGLSAFVAYESDTKNLGGDSSSTIGISYAAFGNGFVTLQGSTYNSDVDDVETSGTEWAISYSIGF